VFATGNFEVEVGKDDQIGVAGAVTFLKPNGTDQNIETGVQDDASSTILADSV
jgi:hypothetical protein